MTCYSEYVPQLHARGFRVTVQRMAILHVLRHSQTHLSPTEVYELARQELPGLTETTVYRTLEFLARNDLAKPTHMGNGHLMYEIAGSDHHHLVCRQCGDEVEVKIALFKAINKELESVSGYILRNNHVTLFGLCPECQKTELKKGA
jgi:Fur family transcriptional regulator, ferric uptake regulator